MTAEPVFLPAGAGYTDIVGFETLPVRITGRPAIRASFDVVVSCSSPMSPLSPGAAPGQRLTALGSAPRHVPAASSAKAPRKAFGFMAQANASAAWESIPFVPAARCGGLT